MIKKIVYKNKMRKNVLLLITCLLLCLGCYVQAQESLPVRFVNTGRMAIASNKDVVALYIPHSVLMADPSAQESRVSVVQQGVTSIGGSFYQESKSNVFQVDADGWGTSTGTIIFQGDAPYGVRHIRTRAASSMEGFQRASYYVAFPNLSIATNDTIRIPGRMGVDAISVSYRSDSEKGIIYLNSDVDATGTKVFDASLRISAIGVSDAASRTSEKLVAAGSVVVERDLSIYRSNTNPLFPFASPMTNLRAGYFAGNFVRKFIEEDAYAGHVDYVLANKDENNDGWIDDDQYLRQADALFEAGKAYLIKPRPEGYDYSQLPFDQTGGMAASVYDQGKFVFDGTIYNLDKTVEQLFAGDEIFRKELAGASYNKTVNWLIGNSYTSAISIDKIYDEIVNTGLNLSSTIYIYPAGSTSYVPYSFSPSAVNIIDLSDIPSMTYFMVRLSKNKTQTGSFAINRSMQTHGKQSNNFMRSRRLYNDELIFRVSPDDNSNVYDLAAIALRDKVSGGQAKVTNPQKDAFQLYSGNKMSVAVELKGTKVVPLGFIPSANIDSYKLSVSRVESMTTEELWLEDRKTGKWVNLYETNEYAFEANADDVEERFYVHFAAQNTTGDDCSNQSPLTAYYHNDNIIIHGLHAQDMDAAIRVSDVQGRSIINTKVGNYPDETIHATLTTGVYLVHIGGNRNQVVKILAKGGTK
ncbi:T9SS C-terminal target domain-containing protein [Paludibacter sp. 221]|uniref:T9SS type A sorting domain-containing protein n=1 Tax=Paludibacter sp. 221 TaxID=2302939 RepID=UPI0013D2695D|nr:T9SS type A sorting domain-containing protein [Paludibacter sp. 221]NDV47052.1 T9SS C-terminal target domain-containing protein [Paludibacter sp. 221]